MRVVATKPQYAQIVEAVRLARLVANSAVFGEAIIERFERGHGVAGKDIGIAQAA